LEGVFFKDRIQGEKKICGGLGKGAAHRLIMRIWHALKKLFPTSKGDPQPIWLNNMVFFAQPFCVMPNSRRPWKNYLQQKERRYGGRSRWDEQWLEILNKL